ncbi:MAG: hypothetical protein ONB23_04035 [candidate division KSB1 bacterium]|nr:hypothetical protein [candidate division KSB1 bacterium]
MNEGGVRLRHRGATARGVAIVLVVGLSTAALSGSLQAQFADQHELLAEPFLLLRVTASPETVRTADQIITFRVEYHNAGTSTADSVILHFFGPNEAAGQYFTELVSLSRAAADTEFVTGSKFRWAIFPIGTLRPGERGEVEVRLRLAPDALETRTLTGVATIRSPGYRASSSAADVIAVFQARTQTDKRLVTGAYFGSDSILFIITVRNTGNWAADSVVVWDFLPPGMRFVSSKPDTFETREDTLIWVIPRIEAQTSFAILVRTYLPWPAEPRPGELHNTCGSRLKEVRSAPYVLHFPVEIPPLPDLVPEWIPPANVLSPGYPASLSLRVHNRGGAPARSFWLTLYVDAVPTDSIHIDGLPARSLSDLPWVKWTPSDTGRYQLVVIADRGEQIREMNEANNADTLWVRVGITSLNVVIRSVTLSDTLPNRLPDGAESAGFPCPILSYVSITDQNGLPVLGLADTGRWLGAGDTTLLGLPIPEIWRTLLEYHLADPTYPLIQMCIGRVRSGFERCVPCGRRCRWCW